MKQRLKGGTEIGTCLSLQSSELHNGRTLISFRYSRSCKEQKGRDLYHIRCPFGWGKLEK